MIDGQRNSPLEVEGSRYGLKTLVCHYIHSMCGVQNCFIAMGKAILLQLPERSLWDGKAQLTQGKVHHLSFSTERTHLTKPADPC